MNIRTEAANTQIRMYCTYLGIFLGAFCLYILFSHHIPVTDPVESNYVLTAKEMVLTSDWLSPRIYGNVWYDKPVFFYWLTALSFKVFGFSDGAARLAPALFAAAGLTLLYWFTAKVSNKSTAFTAAMILGTSLEYGLLAKLVITDMVFFVFNSAALASFYLGFTNRQNNKRGYLAMYACLGLAILTKGPVGLLLPGLVIILFVAIQGKWADFKDLLMPSGLILFAVISLPWYGAMYAVHGTDFLNTFLGVHNYLRATVSEHPNDNVFYYYILVFFVSMLPWSGFACKGIAKGYRDWRSKSSSVSLYCLLWTAVYFVFYSIMATKYITYIFPILFPVAVLTASYLEQVAAAKDAKTVVYWGGIPFGLLGAVYIASAGRYLAGTGLIISIGCLLAVGAFIWQQAKSKGAKQLLELLYFGQIAFFIILSVFVYPQIAETRTGKAVAAVITDTGKPQVGFYQFYSTSSVYYSGTVAVKIVSHDVLTGGQSGTLAWSRKYTMPVQTLDGFAAAGTKNTMIIVPEKITGQFAEEAKHLRPKWLKSDGEYSYYTLDLREK